MDIVSLDALAERYLSLSDDEQENAARYIFEADKNDACPPAAPGKRGPKSRRAELLRLAAFIFVGEQKSNGAYHPGMRAIIEAAFKGNGELRPRSRVTSKNESWESAAGEYRKLEVEWRPKDEQWAASQEPDFQTLIESVNEDGRRLILALMALLKILLEDVDGKGTEESWRRQRRLDRWRALCLQVLGPELFGRMHKIFRPPSMRDLLVGSGLQHEAEKQRIERKPFHPNSSVCRET